MADFSGVTIVPSSTNVSTGQTLTLTVNGSAQQATSQSLIATVNIATQDGTQTGTITLPTITLNGTKAVPAVITSVSDNLGHTWTVAPDGHSASTTA